MKKLATALLMFFIHGMAGFAGCVGRMKWRGSAPHFTASHTIDADTHAAQKGNVSQELVELHADDAAALIKALHLAPVNSRRIERRRAHFD